MHTFQGKDSLEIQHWLHEKGLFEGLASHMTGPLTPLPDNFTAPARTPWGGRKILGTYKHGLPISAEKQYPVVGESWEISADPASPCEFIFNINSTQINLNFIQLLDLFPEQILGSRLAAKFDGQNPILVKLLDADDHLSVQVHPSDDYEGLKPDEAGKPESWYILEARPGSGLFLGLKEHVSKERFRSAIEDNEDLSRYLNFVEVARGDFYVIDAGTIHAIGAGVTLIEPQKIAPKRTGKTYRVWDWNRKYDAQGRKDPHGHARELHIEDSLHVIDFNAPRGDAFVAHIQPTAQTIQQHGGSAELRCMESEDFGVSRIRLVDGKTLQGDCCNSFHGIIPYEGVMEIYAQGQKIADIPCGQSVILPASLGEYELSSTSARAIKVYYPDQYL
ncbi:hypothetical protein CSB45_05715 [candidate division KSB3 bacterium]|uniref:Phosphomannose isomerase type I catalytic domain-containing protein n=1 Tax=candidate division KSB3 bacterium TaxID=2044937 RepID=A0A2G6E6L4_9BACT|nr:MAG: hypothetical protein CSB45_05715 [candidate division KSB3 bacterium]PIE30150.1 MAG: hypothetical protein CSA57_04425 [candidate division KSB3 bacterium]